MMGGCCCLHMSQLFSGAKVNTVDSWTSLVWNRFASWSTRWIKCLERSSLNDFRRLDLLRFLCLLLWCHQRAGGWVGARKLGCLVFIRYHPFASGDHWQDETDFAEDLLEERRCWKKSSFSADFGHQQDSGLHTEGWRHRQRWDACTCLVHKFLFHMFSGQVPSTS